jgi:hypothetical protein
VTRVTHRRWLRSDLDPVTWNTPLALLLALGLAACSSAPSTHPDWRGDARDAAVRAAGAAGQVAGATWEAAQATGEGLQTAAHGLRRGFERPAGEVDYGRPPADTAATVRDHFERVLRVPASASYRIGRPVKGFMNEGLLQGGEVAWRGYLVDVEVTQRAALFGSATRSQAYVVRLRDGRVVDVHRGAEHRFLGRVAERNRTQTSSLP